MYDVISIGELIIDFAPVSVTREGYPTIAANAGGAPGNFLATLSRYGAKTYVYAKVGDDAFGKLLINSLKKEGVDTSGIVEDPEVFTTLAFVALDETGNRSFSFSRKPGADTCLRVEELDLPQIIGAKYFHFDSLPMTHNPCRKATKKAAKYARQAGTLVLFDPNYRPPLWDSEEKAKKQILWGLRHSDIVKICDEEVEFLWGINPMDGAHKLLNEFGTRLVMLTCGAKGAYLLTRKARAFAACPEVKSVDTTGAGDIFAGSAIHKMLEIGAAPEDLTEENLAETVKFAVTAASISTQTKGALLSIPDKVDVMKML